MIVSAGAKHDLRSLELRDGAGGQATVATVPIGSTDRIGRVWHVRCAVCETGRPQHATTIP